MVEHLPDHVIAELARRQAAHRHMQEEAAVREALIAHVQRAFAAELEQHTDPYVESLMGDILHGLAEIAVDALADFVDRGHEFVEPWHGRATTHG